MKSPSVRPAAAPSIRGSLYAGQIAVKRAIILLRFDWLTGLIGALLSSP
jgi:hypothetical protein